MSGTAIKITSEFFTASAIEKTLKPSFFAAAADALPLRRPTETPKPAVLQIQGVGATERTVADYRNGLFFEDVFVRVLFLVNFSRRHFSKNFRKIMQAGGFNATL